MNPKSKEAKRMKRARFYLKTTQTQREAPAAAASAAGGAFVQTSFHCYSFSYSFVSRIIYVQCASSSFNGLFVPYSLFNGSRA